MDKFEWRDPARPRTLEPIDIEPHFRRIWQAHHSQLPAQSCLAITLESESQPTIRPLPASKKLLLGLFDVSFVKEDGVKVTLREEECIRQLGTPKRRTRQIGLLRPWKPLRVLLNGRYSSYSGQTYHVGEYHLMLCADPAPVHLEESRLVDLQADLL